MIDNDIVKIANETKKLNAMVVEDEQEANELMVSTFSNFFNTIDSAMNAEDALEILMLYLSTLSFQVWMVLSLHAKSVRSIQIKSS